MVNSIEVHKLLKILNKVSCGFSLLFNTYLIFLIITKSPKELSVYKYILIFTSIFEMAYSILEAYLVPIHFSFDATDLVMISVTDKSLSPFSLTILNTMYFGFLGSTLSIYAVHFVYRYLTVSKNKLISTFNSWKLILWLMIPFSIGIVWCFIGFILCRPDQETTELSRKHVLESFGEPIEHFVYLGGSMYKTMEDGSIVIYYNLLSAVGLMSTTVIASFVIITYCGVKCYSLIRHMMLNTSTVSSKSRSLQSQLFYALVIQIVIPTVLLTIPITVFFILSLSNNGMEGYSGYLSFLITLYPPVDPLPNFFVIAPYRKAIFGCLRKKSQVYADGSAQPNSFNISNI